MSTWFQSDCAIGKEIFTVTNRNAVNSEVNHRLECDCCVSSKNAGKRKEIINSFPSFVNSVIACLRCAILRNDISRYFRGGLHCLQNKFYVSSAGNSEVSLNESFYW